MCGTSRWLSAAYFSLRHRPVGVTRCCCAPNLSDQRDLSHHPSKNILHTYAPRTSLRKATVEVLRKNKKKTPKPWQSVTYHNPYCSLARAKVVKRITRDVSRAFCGLCEWPVSGNPLMGIWWGCRDATANMNRGDDGSVVECFFSGDTSEGTRHSFMDGRSIFLLFPLLWQHALERIFVLNLWHADV